MKTKTKIKTGKIKLENKKSILNIYHDDCGIIL